MLIKLVWGSGSSVVCAKRQDDQLLRLKEVKRGDLGRASRLAR
jgi:hypothetical protein